jgi:hypothetical protein
MIRFRILFLIMAGVTFLAILAPLILGLASAVFSYHGKCYGFTDGSWPCSWQEYASSQVFWAALLDIPLSAFIIPGWLVALGIWLYKRRSAVQSGVPLSLVILIPIGACLGGGCLITIFPVFLRLFYGFYS